MDAGPLSRLLSEIKTGCRHLLGENLTGIYLHGSVAFGCFRWEKSDIDFLVVVKEELPHGIKRRLMDLILRLSESAPPKGLEMSVVLESGMPPCPASGSFSASLFQYAPGTLQRESGGIPCGDERR